MPPLRARLLAGLLATTACGSPSSPAPVPAAELFLPSRSGAVPVVVLVPGGGWRSADPGGLVPLAKALAEAGYVAATVTYRAADAGEHFPTPVEDVLCAAASAVAQAAAAGRRGGPLVLVGHSAGGQLALLAALRPAAFRSSCPSPDVTPDGVVGLAGAYDTHALGDLAVDLFGVPEAQDPGRWHEGDALAWVGERPSLPVLLLHGAADELVPVAMTERLGRALATAGHPVRTEVVAGADHGEVYRPEIIGTLLLDWLAQLRPARPGEATNGQGRYCSSIATTTPCSTSRWNKAALPRAVFR